MTVFFSLARDCTMTGLIVLLLSATPTHLAYEQTGEPCPADDPCPDPTRPWMRGAVEKSCARKEHVQLMREQNPGRTILECSCKHTCEPTHPLAAETNDRAWDVKCAARCSPNGCVCRHPCQE